MAATCVYLACKSEEVPRKLRDVAEAVMASHDKTQDGMKAFEAKDYRRWGERHDIRVREEKILTNPKKIQSLHFGFLLSLDFFGLTF